MRKLMGMVLASLSLSGCGDGKPPEKTVFDPQIQAIKKARDVEQKLRDAAHKERENVQRQESGEK